MASRLKAAAEATVALGLTAGAGFLGMRLFLGSPLNPQDSAVVTGPVPVPPEIAAIADDYQADLQFALHCVEQRWSYLEMRTAEHEGDLMGSLRSIALHHRGLPHPYYDDGEWPTFEYPLVEGEDYRALFEVYFRLNLENLADALRDGHAGVVFPKFRQPAPLRLPFSLVEVREGFMVTRVVDDAVQVQVGDLLLDALEPPTESDFGGASSLAASRWQYVRDWPRATWQDEVELRFERPGVGEYRALLDTVPVWTRVPGERLARAERQHALLEGNIGYFRPGNFSPPPDSGWSEAPPEDRDGILAETYADFDRRLGELSGARALVLDLRGNPGGTDLLGQFLVDRLIDGDYVYFQLSSLRKSGWSEFHELGSSAPSGETELHVPLAVLIDERTFSTADNVVACLADVHPDVIFVGQPNGAGSGAPRGFELPRTGATLCFCTQRVADPNGDLIEGQRRSRTSPCVPRAPSGWLVKTPFSMWPSARCSGSFELNSPVGLPTVPPHRMALYPRVLGFISRALTALAQSHFQQLANQVVRLVVVICNVGGRPHSVVESVPGVLGGYPQFIHFSNER